VFRHGDVPSDLLLPPLLSSGRLAMPASCCGGHTNIVAGEARSIICCLNYLSLVHDVMTEPSARCQVLKCTIQTAHGRHCRCQLRAPKTSKLGVCNADSGSSYISQFQMEVVSTHSDVKAAKGPHRNLDARIIGIRCKIPGACRLTGSC